MLLLYQTAFQLHTSLAHPICILSPFPGRGHTQLVDQQMSAPGFRKTTHLQFCNKTNLVQPFEPCIVFFARLYCPPGLFCNAYHQSINASSKQTCDVLNGKFGAKNLSDHKMNDYKLVRNSLKFSFINTKPYFRYCIFLQAASDFLCILGCSFTRSTEMTRFEDDEDLKPMPKVE